MAVFGREGAELKSGKSSTEQSSKEGPGARQGANSERKLRFGDQERVQPLYHRTEKT